MKKGIFFSSLNSHPAVDKYLAWSMHENAQKTPTTFLSR
jgi:hypothetical protein